MRYSTEPRYIIYLEYNKPRIYVKGYEFLSFAKNIDIHITKVAKNMSNKYSQKFIDGAKRSTTDVIKTAS